LGVPALVKARQFASRRFDSCGGSNFFITDTAFAMRQLRPVPLAVRKTNSGTLHIINMRDYQGETERTLCGYTNALFKRLDSTTSIENALDDPQMCGKCKQSFQANHS
jgi:hypothetical protein